MRKHILALLAAACSLVSTHADAGWNLRLRGTVSPTPPSGVDVIPGATQPLYDNSASTATLVKFQAGTVPVNDISPAYHGNSGDNGYGLRGSGRWDALPFALVTGVQHIGLFAWHPPTDVEMAAGLYSNIVSVKVRCDGGQWYTISAPSSNSDAGGTTDWNFTVNDANYADGLHKCDAIAQPATGPDIVMNGPPFSNGGSIYETQSTGNIIIDNGTRGTAGHILTIPTGAGTFNWATATASGVIGYGWSISAKGVVAGTFIDGDANTNASLCVAETGSNCTGSGGVGTYHVTQSNLVYGAVLTGGIDNGAGAPGTLLTVSGRTSGGMSLNLIYGAILYGAGVTDGTKLNGANNQSGTNCTAQSGAFCTGKGMTGTYTVTATQLVAAGTTLYATTPAEFGNQRSYYFITNHNGTLPRATVYVNASTGSDGNSGTAASPYLTIGKALTAGTAADSSTTYHKGKWGVTICLEGGQAYGYSGSVTNPDSSIGYSTYRSAAAGDALCPNSGDPGGATVINAPQSSTRSYWPNRTLWQYVNFSGTADTLGSGGVRTLVVDHVIQVSDTLGYGGLLGAGGWMCLESTTWFGTDGACSGALMVRNTTANYGMQDCFHDVSIVVGNLCDADGYYETWATATSDGSSTLQNVTFGASELAGRTLSSVYAALPAGFHITAVSTATGFANCFTALTTGPSAVDDVNHTVSFSTLTPSGSCPNGQTVYLFAGNAHPDGMQISGLDMHSDVLVMNNSFGPNFSSYAQGLFLEDEGMSGVLVTGNTVKATNSSFTPTMVAVNGNNENVIFSGNTFSGSAGFNLDLAVGSANETLVKDQCLSGGTLTPVNAGVNVRALAAASSACYATSP